MSIRVVCGVALIMLLGPSMALAFYDTPILDPPHPVTGEPIGFSVRAGVCDLVDAPPIAGDQYRELTVVGNVVQVTVRALDGNFNEDFCIYPTATARFSIGTLPAGRYRLDLYRRDLAELTNIRLTTSTEFTVSPAAVPAMSWMGLAILATVLVAMAGVSAQAPR